MVSKDMQNSIQEELDKAVRQINAVLRLMHRGAMKHDQARAELSALVKGVGKVEIARCVEQAVKAIDLNEQSARESRNQDTLTRL